MLKHLSTRQTTADHLRTPSNEDSEGQSDHQPPSRRLLTNNMTPHPSQQQHQLANGYVSPGRYSAVGSHKQQQQQQQLHVSMLNSSKHSLSPTTSVSPGTGANHTKTTLTNLDHSRDESLPFNFSHGPLSSSIFITDRSLPNGNHTFLSNRWECFFCFFPILIQRRWLWCTGVKKQHKSDHFLCHSQWRGE